MGGVQIAMISNVGDELKAMQATVKGFEGLLLNRHADKDEGPHRRIGNPWVGPYELPRDMMLNCTGGIHFPQQVLGWRVVIQACHFPVAYFLVW